MDIQYLREFVSAAENGSLPAAADELFISPSLLSLHVRKIEEELGYPLFERTSRTLVLNDAGRLFLPFARKIVTTLDLYKTKAANALTEAQNQLNIGLIGSVAQTATEDLIAKFYKNNPDVHLYIKSRDYPPLLLNFLTSRQCDFIFLYDNADNRIENVIAEQLLVDRIVAVVPQNHPIARHSRIVPNDLWNEDILMQNSDSKISNKITHYFEKHGIKLNVSYAVNSHALMEDLLEMGSGIGLMPQSSAERLHNRNLSILTIEPMLSINFCMLYLDKPHYSDAEKQFIWFVQDNYGIPRRRFP